MKDVKEIINISSVCIETYPCKHYISYVTKDGFKEQKAMFIQDIYKYNIPYHIENEYNFWRNNQNLSSFNEKFKKNNNEKSCSLL